MRIYGREHRNYYVFYNNYKLLLVIKKFSAYNTRAEYSFFLYYYLLARSSRVLTTTSLNARHLYDVMGALVLFEFIYNERIYIFSTSVLE